MYLLTHTPQARVPWNKGKLCGQKPPLKLQEIWTIRVQLQMAKRIRDLALFNLAIDSKLRSCDLVRLRVREISNGSSIAKRAMVIQQKTQHPGQFEIMKHTRHAIEDLIIYDGLTSDDCLNTDTRNPPIFRLGNMLDL